MRERRPPRFVLVLEVHERLLELLRLRGPPLQRRQIIVQPSQAEISVTRSLFGRRRQLVALRHAQRRSRVAQRRKRLVVEPALMAELERRLEVARELVEEVAQERQIRLEIRWKL